jgi:hypothetical protein
MILSLQRDRLQGQQNGYRGVSVTQTRATSATPRVG